MNRDVRIRGPHVQVSKWKPQIVLDFLHIQGSLNYSDTVDLHRLLGEVLEEFRMRGWADFQWEEE